MGDFLRQILLRRKWLQFVILALAGAAAGLGQAPFDLWFVTIAVFGLLFSLYPSVTSPRQSAFVLWCLGVGYFAFSLRWIVEPFLVDVARYGWMAPFALFLMAAGGAIFWAIAGWFAARFAPNSGSLLALALVAVEIARSLIFTGFPWALIGHIWIATDLAQLAAFGGPHLLSLVTVGSGLLVAALFNRHYLSGSAGLAALAALAFFLQPAPSVEASPDAPVVRLVQPNAPQDQKWDPTLRDLFLNRMIALSSEGDVPDLVVWPETSVPYMLGQIEGDMRVLTDSARGAPLVFGIQRRNMDGQYFNSLVVADADGQVQSLYDKRHLVPFGEYVPGARLLGRMGMAGLAGNLGVGFTPGSDGNIVDLPGIGEAVALICYEGIFAEEITYEERPRLLLLITNDAWFGQSAGPSQHLAQARLRAIEHGLPMVRVANTGISAVFDGKGRSMGSMPLNVDRALDVELPPVSPETIYVRVGDWPVFGIIALLMFGSIIWARRDSD
ncbi:apolipoprotein N-acyltransferase [Yoonia sp.]|uniref:apolipoprotein N-acyltransferase n=1 Tax=Yoonia sp. TaxID=2212373 RepID=UPI0035C8483D